MRNLNLTIKSALLAVFLAWAGISHAAPGDLVVEFENTPLFSETNFMPGGEAAKWVKVSNNTSVPHAIIVEAINKVNPDGLGDLLNLQIKENGNILYNNNLSNFFNSGEVVMSNLSGNSSTTYDFIVGFDTTTSNDYQEKNLGFDLLIGFQGQGGEQSSDGQFSVSSGSSSSGLGAVGGSGGPYQGLLISNEALPLVNGNDVTITWNTSYYSTSQVIFGPDSGGPYNLNIALPNFGYASSSPDFLNKVLNHSVTIYNLPPGNYLYRVVSHASPPTISFEHSFSISSNSGESAGDNFSSKLSSVSAGGNKNSKQSSGSKEILNDGTEQGIGDDTKIDSKNISYRDYANPTDSGKSSSVGKLIFKEDEQKPKVNNLASVFSVFDEIPAALKFIFIFLFVILISWVIFLRRKEN